MTTQPDFALVSVERLILHIIPRQYRGQPEQGLYLSSGESPLDAGLRTYIRNKLIEGVGDRRAMLAGWTDQFGTTVRDSVEVLLQQNETAPDQFVARSHDIARALYALQTGVISPGILMVVQISVNGARGLCLMKLDSQRGIRVIEPSAEDQHTLSLEQIRNLVMSDDTRLQKLGAFVTHSEAGDGTWIKVCDLQIGDLSYGETATFWRRFLGVDISMGQAPVVTRNFKEQGEAFINQNAPNPNTKAKWQVGMQAYLSGEENVINTQDFANRTFPEKLRDDFVTKMKEVGIDDHDYSKDISHVKSQLDLIRLPLDSGVVVLTPRQKLDQAVTIRDLEHGQVEIIARGVLLNVDGRNRA